MTTSEALEKVADYIEKKGWCQNDLTDSKGRVCIVQAMHMIASPCLQYINAGIAISKELGFTDLYGLVTYNNTPGRTMEEVVTTIRNAKRWAQ